jgi:GNAT superfamily N-acetyltransferase
MIEVRSFDGGYEELAQFVAKAWRENYRGRMPVPHWSADFFARDGGPEEIAMDWSGAAYDGTRLVGLLPGWPIKVMIHGQEELVRTGTGASVDAEYQRKGVGTKLNQWAMEHAREHGCGATLFYLYDRTGQFKGTKFWKSRGMPTELVCKLAQWVRPLNHTAVARWELWRFEGWGTRMLQPLQWRVRPPARAEGIRPFGSEDLDACAALVRARSESMDLARQFDTEALSRQLDFKDVTRTTVIEHEGRVAGLVNVVYLDIFGRTEERFGMIDLLAFDAALPHRRRVALLRTVLYRMQEDGLAGSFMLRGSGYAWRAMLGVGFWPMFPEYSLMAIKNREDVNVAKIRRVFHLWR